MNFKDKIEHIKKCMDKCKWTEDWFNIQLEEKCDKCQRSYMWLSLSIKLPEVIVLCEHCWWKVDPENNKERTRPPFIIWEE